jgi:hypothetical protein
MGFWSRLFGMAKPGGRGFEGESRVETGGLASRPAGASADAEPPMTRTEAEVEIVKFARSKIPPASELTYYFVCSGNRSLIEAYHGLFRVGAPAYGGSAAYYRGDHGQLRARQAEPAAASLPFAGQRCMGSSVGEMATVADVLSDVSVAGYQGVFISHVTVGPSGRDWVREVYTTLLGEAVKQGILPFSMYTTSSEEAAQFLIDSFSPVSAA